VMPHNLYLHSSIVQTRKYEHTPEGRREAIKFATLDSSIALMLALDHPDCVGALALISPATHPVLPTVLRVLAIRSPA